MELFRLKQAPNRTGATGKSFVFPKSRRLEKYFVKCLVDVVDVVVVVVVAGVSSNFAGL